MSNDGNFYCEMDSLTDEIRHLREELSTYVQAYKDVSRVAAEYIEAVNILVHDIGIDIICWYDNLYMIEAKSGRITPEQYEKLSKVINVKKEG